MEQVWQEFAETLVGKALDKQKETEAHRYRKQREKEIDEMLEVNLTRDEKVLVDEVMFELGVASDKEGVMLYQRGLQDGMCLLKRLGVIA